MERLIRFRGGNIHCFDEGEGPVILLIHGYLESAVIWKRFAEKLSGEFRVIAINLPGHGQSDIDEIHDTMEFFASVVKEILDALSIDRVFLVGHSLGGYVTLAFLELFPHRLTGYCLFHSQPFADTPEATEKRNREIQIVSEGRKEVIIPANITRMFADQNVERMPGELARSKEIASAITAGGIISVLKAMISRPSRSWLMEEGRVPCLWILGLKDNYIPCEAIQKRVRLPLNVKTVVLENSGHLGFVEEEERSVKALSEFVISSLPSQ
jgi:pimeloyl-ACP methyl ester carboxylesterase